MRKSKCATVSGTFTLFYTKMSLPVVRLLHATTSGALPFVDFKIYFYHSYSLIINIIIIIYKKTGWSLLVFEYQLSFKNLRSMKKKKERTCSFTSYTSCLISIHSHISLDHFNILKKFHTRPEIIGLIRYGASQKNKLYFIWEMNFTDL
jgi:hypothetical protein